MQLPDENSDSPRKFLLGLWATLGSAVVMVAAGVAYGMAQLRHGADHFNESSRLLTASFVAARAPQAASAMQGPPIIIVGNPVHGRELFGMSCFVCHGPSGAGVPGLGANLRLSRFIRTRTDHQLITFIKMGRQPGDPNSVLNGTMPPKGGNPMLDDAGLQDVVAFLRSLQATAAATQWPKASDHDP